MYIDPSKLAVTEILDGYSYTRVLDPLAFGQASAYCNRYHDGGYLAHVRSENVSKTVDRIIR